MCFLHLVDVIHLPYLLIGQSGDASTELKLSWFFKQVYGLKLEFKQKEGIRESKLLAFRLPTYAV